MQHASGVFLPIVSSFARLQQAGPKQRACWLLAAQAAQRVLPCATRIAEFGPPAPQPPQPPDSAPAEQQCTLLLMATGLNTTRGAMRRHGDDFCCRPHFPRRCVTWACCCAWAHCAHFTHTHMRRAVLLQGRGDWTARHSRPGCVGGGTEFLARCKPARALAGEMKPRTHSAKHAQ
jgi:hypothetical protein